jgi:hypothetical protein
MPYFVYNIFPQRRLEYIEEFSGYRDARDRVRELRKTVPEDADYTVRLVHAKHKSEAERLLTTEREARPAGEE